MPLILVVTALPPDFSTLSISSAKIKILFEVFLFYRYYDQIFFSSVIWNRQRKHWPYNERKSRFYAWACIWFEQSSKWGKIPERKSWSKEILMSPSYRLKKHWIQISKSNFIIKILKPISAWAQAQQDHRNGYVWVKAKILEPSIKILLKVILIKYETIFLILTQFAFLVVTNTFEVSVIFIFKLFSKCFSIERSIL